MFCEPMSLLLRTRFSITARSVPSSPTDTLLMEALFFLQKDVFVTQKNKQPPSFSVSPSSQKETLPSSPSKNPLKVATGISKQVLVLPQKDFWICQILKKACLVTNSMSWNVVELWERDVRVTCRGVAGKGLCISSDYRGSRANIPTL